MSDSNRYEKSYRCPADYCMEEFTVPETCSKHREHINFKNILKYIKLYPEGDMSWIAVYLSDVLNSKGV